LGDVEVPGNQRIAPEEGADGAQGQERAERNRGAAVAPLLTYFAVNQSMGFAKPMMYGTIGSLVVYVVAVFLGPETKGKVMTADLEVIEVEVPA